MKKDTLKARAQSAKSARAVNDMVSQTAHGRRASAEILAARPASVGPAEVPQVPPLSLLGCWVQACSHGWDSELLPHSIALQRASLGHSGGHLSFEG
jgi:hypothetical protein